MWKKTSGSAYRLSNDSWEKLIQQITAEHINALFRGGSDSCLHEFADWLKTQGDREQLKGEKQKKIISDLMGLGISRKLANRFFKLAYRIAYFSDDLFYVEGVGYSPKSTSSSRHPSPQPCCSPQLFRPSLNEKRETSGALGEKPQPWQFH